MPSLPTSRLVAAGATLAALTAVIVVDPLGPRGTVLIDDLLVVGIPAAAAIRLGRIARRRPHGCRAGCSLLAAGAAVWVVVTAPWAWLDVTGRHTPHFPFVSDLVYVAIGPMWAAGLLLIVEAPTTPAQLRRFADGLIAAVVAFVAVWSALNAFAVVDDRVTRVLLVLYPAGAAGAAVASALSIAGTQPRHRPLMWWLSGATVAVTGGLTAYAFLAAHHAYRTGTVLDLTWTAGFLVLLVVEIPDEQLAPRRLPLNVLALPALAAGIAGTVVATTAAFGRPAPTPIWVAVALAMVALMAREILTLLDTAQLTRRLERATTRIAKVLARTGDVVAIVGDDLRIRYVGDSVAAMLGRSPDQLVGHDVLELLHPDDRLAVMHGYGEVISRADRQVRGEMRAQHSNGSWVWIEVNCTNALHDPDVNGVVLSARDSTERHDHEQRLAYRVGHDPLTDLANRPELVAKLRETIRDGAAAALMFVDVDGFKAVNDAYGHLVGDAVLVELAHRLRNAVRPTDLVARVGGDEFVALCFGVTDRAVAETLADRVVRAFGSPVTVGPRQARVGASVGIRMLRPGDHADSALADADAAMYRAKRDGGARRSLTV